MSDKKLRVFVSCRLSDAEYVEMFAECLQDSGEIDVVWAGDTRTFVPDDVIPERVFDSIKGADILLVFGTKAAEGSSWVFPVEVPTARLLGKPTPLLEINSPKTGGKRKGQKSVGDDRLTIKAPGLTDKMRKIIKEKRKTAVTDLSKEIGAIEHKLLRLHERMEQQETAPQGLANVGSDLIRHLSELAESKARREDAPLDGWSLQSIDVYLAKVKALIDAPVEQQPPEPPSTNERLLCQFTLTDRPDRTGFVPSTLCASVASSYAHDGPSGSWMVLADDTRINVISTIDAIVLQRPSVLASIDLTSVAPNHTIVGLDQVLERGDFLDLVVDLLDGDQGPVIATITLSILSRSFSVSLRPARGGHTGVLKPTVARVRLDRVVRHWDGSALPSTVVFNGLSTTTERSSRL